LEQERHLKVATSEETLALILCFPPSLLQAAAVEGHMLALLPLRHLVKMVAPVAVLAIQTQAVRVLEPLVKAIMAVKVHQV
jgi:hypothetical protein